VEVEATVKVMAEVVCTLKRYLPPETSSDQSSPLSSGPREAMPAPLAMATDAGFAQAETVMDRSGTVKLYCAAAGTRTRLETAPLKLAAVPRKGWPPV
jgi:hypothetical protein